MNPWKVVMHIPRIIFTRPHQSRRRARSLGPRDVCGDGRGNVKGGQVTGETDKIAAEPAWIGYSPDDLAASFSQRSRTAPNSAPGRCETRRCYQRRLLVRAHPPYCIAVKLHRTCVKVTVKQRVWQQFLAVLSFGGGRGWPEEVPLVAISQGGQGCDGFCVGHVPSATAAFQA